MKNKILIFIIGLLVGAIISTIGFIIYEKNNKSNAPQGPQMMQGQNAMGNNQGTPPEKPAGENDNSVQGGTPPEKPAGEMNNSNTVNQNSTNTK